MSKTNIYKQSDYGEIQMGYIDAENQIHRTLGIQDYIVGRVSADQNVYMNTRYNEQELGQYTQDGRIRSNGLFEGGDIGWVEPDGVVVQAGLILGEEDVGRVEGEKQDAGAAVLLLLFLPQEIEENRRQARRY